MLAACIIDTHQTPHRGSRPEIDEESEDTAVWCEKLFIILYHMDAKRCSSDAAATHFMWRFNNPQPFPAVSFKISYKYMRYFWFLCYMSTITWKVIFSLHRLSSTRVCFFFLFFFFLPVNEKNIITSKLQEEKRMKDSR